MNPTRPEYRCYRCSTRVEFDRKPGRRDECPKCGAELHVCLNCALYDAGLSRGCRESQAEEVREKERANFCGWFEFREARASDTGADAAKQAAAAFFGSTVEAKEPAFRFTKAKEAEPNPLARFFEPERRDADVERERASDAFDALFKRKD